MGRVPKIGPSEKAQKTAAVQRLSPACTASIHADVLDCASPRALWCAGRQCIMPFQEIETRNWPRLISSWLNGRRDYSDDAAVPTAARKCAGGCATAFSAW